MKKTAIILIGMLVFASLTIPVLAQKQKVVLKIGVGTNQKPLYVVKGTYDDTKNVMKGSNYFFQLHPETGTFDGWIKIIRGITVTISGTYVITNNTILGTYTSSIGLSGWISGIIG